MRQKVAIIVGAGPAGLTAAYELLNRSDVKPVIYERSPDIGGISKTVKYHGNRIDIGGHRFFSKSNKVMQWWLEILPLQSQSNSEQVLTYHRQTRSVNISPEGPNPESEDRVMLLRTRKSRIYFQGKFFDYPLSLTPDTLIKFGLLRTVRITLSYLKSLLFQINNEQNLEQFFINRFGKELYQMFFKSYTEKVWGVPCHMISAEWGSQRIKGLSIARAMGHFLRKLLPQKIDIAQKKTETSLIEKFLYPKYGPGHMWETVAAIIEDQGGEIHLNHRVVGIDQVRGKITAVQIKDEVSGQVKVVKGDYFISTMPIKELIAAMGSEVPRNVIEVTEGLMYRDFITVGLLLKELKIANNGNTSTPNNLISDNWIYIQDDSVKLGRLQIFNNWSPYMVKDPNTVFLGLEYFCNEGDQLWNMLDEEFADFAAEELAHIGIIDKQHVLDHIVIRMTKTYPAYFGTYNKFDVVRNYLDKIENLFLVGRNGMHRYNNQDHSMLTAMTAVENILKGTVDKSNIWAINTEMDYHEEKEEANLTSVENLTEVYLSENTIKGYEYNPDLYWMKTEDTYAYYPTVRHRKRFIVNAVQEYSINSNYFIFDYGCGEGTILTEIQKQFGINPENLAGCDISKEAVAKARKNVQTPFIYDIVFPTLEKRYNIIICSEVIEHTPDYANILHWVRNNLTAEGLFILTTQSGRIHPSDIYTGHTQHFKLKKLVQLMEDMGFKIHTARLWGFPLFTLQKYLTNLNFKHIRQNYLEGDLSLRKTHIFNIAYFSYFMHDFIGFGPQIYITASIDNSIGHLRTSRS